MPEDDVELQEEKQDEEKIDGGNIIFHCTLHDDQERLSKVFDDNEDPYHQCAASLLNERDDIGKSAAEFACILGRSDILKQLIKHGYDVNEANPSGYTLLHFAACWGKRACLKVLVDAGANIDTRTVNGESVKQVALRYKHQCCVDFIDWASARLTLVAFIAHVREMVTDPEKLQGVKLTKDEKNTAIGSCNEKQEWMDNTPDASVEDFLQKKTDLEKQVEHILYKVNSPAPPTGSSGKK